MQQLLIMKKRLLVAEPYKKLWTLKTCHQKMSKSWSSKTCGLHARNFSPNLLVNPRALVVPTTTPIKLDVLTRSHLYFFQRALKPVHSTTVTVIDCNNFKRISLVPAQFIAACLLLWILLTVLFSTYSTGWSPTPQGFNSSLLSIRALWRSAAVFEVTTTAKKM